MPSLLTAWKKIWASANSQRPDSAEASAGVFDGESQRLGVGIDAGVDAGSADQYVGAGVAGEPVIFRAAEQHVLAVAAGDLVFSGSAVDKVITQSATDDVVPGSAENRE